MMLTELRHILEEVSAKEHFDEALNIVAKRIVSTLSTAACSIFLIDAQRQEYVLVATEGLNPKAVGQVRLPTHQGIVGLVSEREEPINISDATQHPRFHREPLLQEDLYRAFLGTPIIYHRNVLGVLIVQQEEPIRYDESQEAFLVTLATQLAAIIAHAEATGALKHLLDTIEGKTTRAPVQNVSYAGVPGVAGIGIGMGVVIYAPDDLENLPDREIEDIEEEVSRFEHALSAVREDLAALSEKLTDSLPAEERALFEVYQRMLDNADLGNEVKTLIASGQWAAGALRTVILQHARRLENTDNDYLRERALDIKDLGQRVLAYLQKNKRKTPHYTPNTILIGETITPIDLANVPEGYLCGIVSMRGSQNSHTAILARALSIPTVMGVRDAPIHALEGKDIIVDGYYGQFYVSPSATIQAEFERILAEEQAFAAILEEDAHLPAVTLDDYRIGLLVNTGLGADISRALSAGAEGVGLYRTEVPFLMRDRFPTSEEQRIIYRQLLASFAPRPVIIRTLDIGGDKPLPYFPIQEDNPFLGWRGIRITLDHPDIFLTQMRAMLRANEGLNNMRIMLPMISDVMEVDEALHLIRKAHAELIDEGHDIHMPQVGVMIEVPSAVYQARALAKRVDFLSVGSNDLTQYLLAVDRNNPRVANLYDTLHPAVLRALIQVVDNGHQEGKHVSICGELAADPAACLLLVAIGFDSLSMNAPAIHRVRYAIRHFSQKKMAQLLQEVLTMESASMIRSHIKLALETAGLNNLTRMGR